VIVAVCGLRQEARIVVSEHVRAIACGGRADVLRRELTAALDYNVRGVISFGICAGLSPELLPGTCVIAAEIVTRDNRVPTDATWSAYLHRLLPKAVRTTVFGTDSLMLTREQKAAARAQTEAAAADMESGVAAEIASRHNLSFVCLRSVADGASANLPHAAFTAVRENGTIDLEAVVSSLIARPLQIPSLVRTARDTRAAFRTLFRCRDVLGSTLACPNFRKPALDVT